MTDTTVVEEPEVVEPAVDPERADLEDRARRMGWRPKDEYNGPASRWVDAGEFIARGETELPILRERLRTLDSRLHNTERQLTEANGRIQEQSSVLNEVRDMARTAQKRGYEQAVIELSERERRAVAEADTATYDRIQQEKRALGPPPAEPVRTTTTAVAPQIPSADKAIIEHWIVENPWYNNDPELNAVATSIHGFMRTQNPAEPLVDNLARVKDRIVQMFPEKFENPRRKAAAAVAASATPVVPKPKHKTVNDLPPEAREALARFQRQMPNYSAEEYLQSYFGDDYAN